jgi:hypothetical protein
MIRKNGNRFSEKIMLQQKIRAPIDSFRSDGVLALAIDASRRKIG